MKSGMLVIRCMSESITANPIMHNKSYRFIIRIRV